MAIKNESHKVLRNETRCDKNQIKLPTGKKNSGPTFVHSFPLSAMSAGPTYGNEETCSRSLCVFPPFLLRMWKSIGTNFSRFESQIQNKNSCSLSFSRLTFGAGRRDAAALKLKWRLFHSQGGTVCEVAGFRFLHWPAECAQIYVAAVPGFMVFYISLCIHIVVCIIFYSFDRFSLLLLLVVQCATTTTSTRTKARNDAYFLLTNTLCREKAAMWKQCSFSTGHILYTHIGEDEHCNAPLPEYWRRAMCVAK